MKIKFIWFSVQLTPIFLREVEEGLKYFAVQKGGIENFSRLNFFASAPLQVFMNGPNDEQIV